MEKIIIISLLVIIAVLLLAVWFIIRTFNDIYDTKSKIDIINQLEIKSRLNTERYVEFEQVIRELYRNSFFDEGNVDATLRKAIKLLQEWLLQSK